MQLSSVVWMQGLLLEAHLTEAPSRLQLVRVVEEREKFRTH